jgi:hypothetical protein
MQGGYPPQQAQYQQPTQQFPPGGQPPYPYPQQGMPPQGAAPKKGRPVWLIVLIVLLALCLLGGLGTVALIAATGRSINTVLNNALATATALAALDVTVPTDTPTDFGSSEPTTEPEAVSTDTPSSSSSNGTDTDEGYLTQWTDWLTKYGEAFTKFSELNLDPKVSDATWRSDVTKEVETIRDTANRVLDYNKAPTTFKGIHRNMQDAATHFVKMADLYNEGLQKQDATILDQATAELAEGNKLMDKAYEGMANLAPGAPGLSTVVVDDTPTAVSQEAEPTSAPISGGELGIGSTGQTGGLKITLNGIKRDSGGFLKPKAGNEYLIVDLTFENTTSEKTTVSSLLSYSIKDSTGQEYSITFGPDIKKSADGDIAAGDKLRGESAFEVPKSATGLVFIYKPFMSGDEVRFKLDK